MPAELTRSTRAIGATTQGKAPLAVSAWWVRPGGGKTVFRRAGIRTQAVKRIGSWRRADLLRQVTLQPLGHTTGIGCGTPESNRASLAYETSGLPTSPSAIKQKAR